MIIWLRMRYRNMHVRHKSSHPSTIRSHQRIRNRRRQNSLILQSGRRTVTYTPSLVNQLERTCKVYWPVWLQHARQELIRQKERSQTKSELLIANAVLIQQLVHKMEQVFYTLYCVRATYQAAI